ncbi:MAG: PAS domain S-box protein, partial [Deltaproteobacteria bacterium]|nr:PAS domain S-box protein [Deltaproteobacteria bacterium]
MKKMPSLSQTRRSTTLIQAILAIILFFGLSSPAFGKEIRVGTYDYSPLVSLDANGKPVGIFIDIVEYVAAEKGWRITYAYGTWQEGLTRLESGLIDLVLSIAQTKIRAATYGINKEPILSTWGQVYSAKSNPLKTVLELDDKFVIGLHGDIYYTALKELAQTFGVKPRYLEADSISEVFDAVSKGRATAGTIDRFGGLAYESMYNVVRSPVVYFPQTYGVAATKGKNQDILDAIDEYILAQRNNPSSHYHKTIQKWLGGEEYEQISTYLTWGLTGATVLFLLTVGISLLLERQVRNKTIELKQQNERLVIQINERERVEKALQENQVLLQSILDNSTAFIYFKDLSGRYLFINNHFSRTLGLRDEDLIGKKDIEVFPREISEKYRENDQKVLKTRRALGFEEITNQQDGPHNFISIKFPVYRPDGLIYAIGGISSDITDNKRAEESVRKSEQRFRAIFDQAPLGIAVIDNQTGQILQINPRFCEIFGRTSEEMLKMDFRRLEIADDFPPDIDEASQYFPPQAQQINKGKRFLRPDDSLVWISLTIVPIWAEGELQLHDLVMVEDISERKRAEKENLKLEAQLKQSQKLEAIGTLAGGIAHDFNNILTAIIGHTELAKLKTLSNPSLNNNLTQIFNASMRAKDLVHQILKFSRRDENVLKAVTLAPIIQEALRLVRSSLPTTIEIRQNIDPLPLTVLGDQTQIHQILINLCANAAYAMRENGGLLDVNLFAVELSPTSPSQPVGLSPGSYACLMVGDTGHGMDLTTKERIFEPFFTTKKPGEGTGMGLSVVYGIVKK